VAERALSGFDKPRLELAGELARLFGARNRSNEILRVVDWAAERGAVVGDSIDGSHAAAPIHIALALAEGLRQAGTSLAEAAPSNRLDPLFSMAHRIALDEKRDEWDRVAGIRLLGHHRQHEAYVDRLFALLDSGGSNGEQRPAAIQGAALAALLQPRSSNVVQGLILRWPNLAPPLRSAMIQTLLSRTEGVSLVIDALEAGKISGSDLSAFHVSFLNSYRDHSLRERAAKVLGTPARTSGAQIAASYEPALNLSGNTARGKETFRSRCASCHRLAGEGTALGPDLASVRGNGKEKLLLSIIDPHREVAPQFTGYVLETNDGESYSGVLVNQSGAAVTLRQAGGIEVTVPRSRVASLTSQGQSMMPDGLEVGLSVQAMADLLEFVMNPAEAAAK
jgi:putative heme-binding domain-containing protein